MKLLRFYPKHYSVPEQFPFRAVLGFRVPEDCLACKRSVPLTVFGRDLGCGYESAGGIFLMFTIVVILLSVLYYCINMVLIFSFAGKGAKATGCC